MLAERELRGREKLLAAIIDTEPECVKLLDAEGRLLMMNPSGLAMLAVSSFEQLRGRCLYPLVAPAHRAAFRALTERVFSGESGRLEFEAQDLEGRSLRLETRAVPLRDDRGEIVSLVGVTWDVTERHRMEEALRAGG